MITIYHPPTEKRPQSYHIRMVEANLGWIVVSILLLIDLWRHW